jgi:hypothetical protein
MRCIQVVPLFIEVQIRMSSSRIFSPSQRVLSKWWNW